MQHTCIRSCILRSICSIHYSLLTLLLCYFWPRGFHTSLPVLFSAVFKWRSAGPACRTRNSSSRPRQCRTVGTVVVDGLESFTTPPPSSSVPWPRLSPRRRSRKPGRSSANPCRTRDEKLSHLDSNWFANWFRMIFVVICRWFCRWFCPKKALKPIKARQQDNKTMNIQTFKHSLCDWKGDINAAAAYQESGEKVPPFDFFWLWCSWCSLMFFDVLAKGRISRIS